MLKPAPIAFDIQNFWAFCLKLKISTKEYGVIQLRPTTTQVYLVNEIAKGLSEGIHQFCVLKCRQAMASTICLALDLYWAFKHEGTTGLIIVDQDSRRISFRVDMKRYVSALPQDPDWRQPITKDSREALTFANSSAVYFTNANQRTKGALGRGIGANLVHGTEVGWWSDEQAFISLKSSMAQKNPNRLFIFESTANGHNLWKEMWDNAMRASTQRAIFIGWWMHDYYQVDEDHAWYKVYWLTDPQPSSQEQSWIDQVKRRFGCEVGPNRLAWWRGHLREEALGNLDMMMQEYPWLPELAFQFSGHPFVNKGALKEHQEVAVESLDMARYFRFKFGRTFIETEIEEVTRRDNYDLCVWREPEFGKGAVYTVGGDPSWGSNELSDQAVLQVLRCYANGVEQVAEFSAVGLPTYRFAWVALYLSGAYSGMGNTLLNIELQGGGAAAFQEIQRVQMDLGTGYEDKLGKHFQGVQHYLYSRPDSVRGGGMSYHTVTNQRNRDIALANFRDYSDRKMLMIRSIDLIDEMAKIARTPEGLLEAPSGEKDDRVMACALALQAYIDRIMWEIGNTPYTYAYFEKVRAMEHQGNDPKAYMEARIDNFLQRITGS
jgi:hypothetical protein